MDLTGLQILMALLGILGHDIRVDPAHAHIAREVRDARRAEHQSHRRWQEQRNALPPKNHGKKGRS